MTRALILMNAESPREVQQNALVSLSLTTTSVHSFRHKSVTTTLQSVFVNYLNITFVYLQEHIRYKMYYLHQFALPLYARCIPGSACICRPTNSLDSTLTSARLKTQSAHHRMHLSQKETSTDHQNYAAKISFLCEYTQNLSHIKYVRFLLTKRICKLTANRCL